MSQKIRCVCCRRMCALDAVPDPLIEFRMGATTDQTEARKRSKTGSKNGSRPVCPVADRAVTLRKEGKVGPRDS